MTFTDVALVDIVLLIILASIALEYGKCLLSEN